MEALKNWLLGAATVAIVFLGFEVRSKSQAIEEMKPPPTPESTAAPAAASATPVQTSAPPPPTREEPAPDTGELLAVQEELGRYKAGLEKCVAALNATVASQRREVRTFVLPGAAPAARPAADVVELSEPYVLPSGNSVVVSGKVYNRGTAPGEVTVVVTLFDNGRQAGSERQRVSVGAGQVTSWRQAFRWDGHEAMWTARVELEE